ncbi:ankyrin repeat-containing domain, PGG domain protein [Tanacetum coccineum]
MTKKESRHSIFVTKAPFSCSVIQGYPDLTWKVNDNNLSIFHSAVKHRREDIYNLLYEIGAMKDMITPLKDKNENNMLHLVGKIAKQKRLADVSGVALQMQRELLWFEEVKKMIPPSYRNRKNKDDLTPQDLFTQEHKELVTLGEKWMKGTANQCMVVAALIATIVFAAAFTVPGGYDQNDGIPMFYSKATFVVFVVADAISLFSSSASILIFLSILTARYAERDFLESIPKKLMAGLATLFISIATMTLTFGVSFFVLYKKGFLWIPILISVFALLLVILYMFLQYGLFADVIRSTYRSRASFNRWPTRPNLSLHCVFLLTTFCPFCEEDIEDLDDCIVNCSRVLGIWRKVWSWWNFDPPLMFPSFFISDIALGNVCTRGDNRIDKVMNGLLHFTI